MVLCAVRDTTQVVVKIDKLEGLGGSNEFSRVGATLGAIMSRNINKVFIFQKVIKPI